MAYNSAYTGAQHDAYVTKESLINLIYPVGAIYISTNSTSPQTLFGGTWQAIEGKFLVGANSTYTAGGSGGSDKHTHTYAHTHTTPATTTESTAITVDQMPSHQHQLPFVANSISDSTSTDQYNFLYGKGQTASAMGQHTEMYNPDANREAEGNEYAYMTKTLGGGAAIPMGKKPPQQTHKVQVRPPKPPISHHISQYICGNVLHNKVRYTKGGVTYGL